MQNSEIRLSDMEAITSRLTAIEQKLDEINKPDPFKGVWLTTKEAAIALGISIRTLQEKRNRLEIPHSQYGGIIRYRAEDLQEYLMDHFINRRVLGGAKI